jgi:sulfur-carrier protein
MKVIIPSPLHSYTGEKRSIEVAGATVAALLDDMDAQYPGMRFRVIDEQGNIRRHLKIFVNRQQIRSLDVALDMNDEIVLVAALSGG